MPTLHTDNTLTTFLDIFTVETARQSQTLDGLVQSLQTGLPAPANATLLVLFRSLDGIRLALYGQWQTAAAHNRYLTQLHEWFALRGLGGLLQQSDSRRYEVVFSLPTGIAPTAKGEDIVILEEFCVSPADQVRLLERHREQAEKALQLPAILTATFHRSLDGERTLNYGRVQSAAAIAALSTQPGFAAQTPYWQGLADNEMHVYRVVRIQTD